MVFPRAPQVGHTITVFFPPIEPTSMPNTIRTNPPMTPNGRAHMPNRNRIAPKQPPTLANFLTCAGTRATLHFTQAATLGAGATLARGGGFQVFCDRSAEQYLHLIASALIISAQ